MGQKTIPQLAFGAVDENSIFPFDTGIQTRKILGKDLAKALFGLVSTWNENQTYAQGDKVFHNGDFWYAVTGTGNSGKNPDDEPLYWMPYRPGALNPQMPSARAALGLATWDDGGTPNSLGAIDGVYAPVLKKIFALSPGGFANNAGMLGVSSNGGIGWSYENGPATSHPTDWTGIDYAPAFGTAVIVGLKASSTDPLAQYQIVQYLDGIGSTGIATNPIANDIWGVKFSPDLMRYVVCGGDASADGVAYSDDGGATWAQGTAPEGTWGRITWADHLQEFIMLSLTASGPEGDRLAISADGIDFTGHLIPNQNYVWRGLTYSKSLKLLVATGNNTGDATKGCMISRNGRDWFLVTMPEAVAYNRVAWCEEMGCFVAVNDAGATYRAAYSFNGITWVAAPLGTGDTWYAIVPDPTRSKFIALGTTTPASAFSRGVGPVITL